MSMDSDAKEAAIIQMMSGFPSSSKITDAMVDAYLAAVDDIGAEAVQRSCTQFAKGLVENRNNAFMPTAAELAANARLWQDAIATVDANRALKIAQRMIVYPVGELPPPPLKPLGPITMEIEGVMRDTSDWSHDEKEEAMRTGKLPKSRVDGAIGKTVVGKIQKMSDK